MCSIGSLFLRRTPGTVDDGVENEVVNLALDTDVFEQEYTVETDIWGTTTEKKADTTARMVDSESARTTTS